MQRARGISLTVSGPLRRKPGDPEVMIPSEHKERIRSLLQFIRTFQCNHQTEHTWFIAYLLGVEERVWEVVVNNIRAEHGGKRTYEVHMEDVDEEIHCDITTELSALLDVRTIVDVEDVPEPKMYQNMELIDDVIHKLELLKKELFLNNIPEPHYDS